MFAWRLPQPLDRVADRQYGGYQVPQWSAEIVLGDQDHLVIQAKVAHGAACHRAVGRWLGGQGTRDVGFPQVTVAALGGVDHPPPHGAVLPDTGHHYLHRKPPSPGR